MEYIEHYNGSFVFNKLCKLQYRHIFEHCIGMSEGSIVYGTDLQNVPGYHNTQRPQGKDRLPGDGLRVMGQFKCHVTEWGGWRVLRNT